MNHNGNGQPKEPDFKFSLKKENLRHDGSLPYEIPCNTEGSTYKQIPKQFLLDRARYAITVLRSRLDITTAKHLSDMKGSVVTDINKLDDELIDIIKKGVPDNFIENEKELAMLCRKISAAVLRFKRSRDSEFKNINTSAGFILKAERAAFRKIFSLSDDPDDAEDSSELETERVEITLGKLGEVCKLYKKIYDLCIAIDSQSYSYHKAALKLLDNSFRSKVAIVFRLFPNKLALESQPIKKRREYKKKYDEFIESIKKIIELNKILIELSAALKDIEESLYSNEFIDDTYDLTTRYQSGFTIKSELGSSIEEISANIEDLIIQASALANRMQNLIQEVKKCEEIQMLAIKMLNFRNNSYSEEG